MMVMIIARSIVANILYLMLCYELHPHVTTHPFSQFIIINTPYAVCRSISNIKYPCPQLLSQRLVHPSLYD